MIKLVGALNPPLIYKAAAFSFCRTVKHATPLIKKVSQTYFTLASKELEQSRVPFFVPSD